MEENLPFSLTRLVIPSTIPSRLVSFLGDILEAHIEISEEGGRLHLNQIELLIVKAQGSSFYFDERYEFLFSGDEFLELEKRFNFFLYRYNETGRIGEVTILKERITFKDSDGREWVFHQRGMR